MQNFHSLDLSKEVLSALEAIGYVTPTPIQAQTVPHALAGSDILGTAQTGTGKTAAYIIPLLEYVLKNEDDKALVITPTREIAIQVATFLNKLLNRKSKLNSALIIGGEPAFKQINQLRTNPRIIIGTPGRIQDFLDSGVLKLHKTKFLVLDEIDRMLDMGFSIQIDGISKFLPETRQTLMFSATFNESLKRVIKQYSKDPVRVSIGSPVAVATTVKQEAIFTTEDEKYNVLCEQLQLRQGSVIVFVKTKFGTEKLAQRLREIGHEVEAIHGDLRQRNREKAMRAFRSKKKRILIATDIAARGLDISHVECVINHDLPQCEEDFIHRIGRTGRAGAQGHAVTLVTSQDHSKWKSINKMIDPNFKADFDVVKSKRPSRKRKDNKFFKEASFGRKNTEGSKRRPEARKVKDGFGAKPASRSSAEIEFHKKSKVQPRKFNKPDVLGEFKKSGESNRFGKNGSKNFGNNSNKANDKRGFKGNKKSSYGLSKQRQNPRPKLTLSS